jgi:hypothetical protein
VRDKKDSVVTSISPPTQEDKILDLGSEWWNKDIEELQRTLGGFLRPFEKETSE